MTKNMLDRVEFGEILDDLRARAEAATPGPWEQNGRDVVADTRQQVCCGQGVFECCGIPDIEGDVFPVVNRCDPTDAAFIAAANPTTILALCDALETRDAEIATLRAEVEKLQDAYHKGQEEMQKKAAALCRDQAQAFLSPEYSTGQPFSTFQERFACGQCANGIEGLEITP